jgi:UDP-3-O-[3-hydroxymyristoyl] N-acetylglucosamine deacetylase / 3-hydroxyacyl-[acyl-carrier-protein] dehydratase
LRNQRTIKKETSYQGPGLHSGREVKLLLRPAEPDSGITFVRTDLMGRPRVRVSHRSAQKKQRQTVIAEGAAEVQTVEHLLSAFTGLGVDNVEIEIDGPELPGADGSAMPYVELVQKAGIVDQKPPRKQFTLDKALVIESGAASMVVLPNPQGLRITYVLEYPGLRQQVTLDVDEQSFVRGIAPARTFCLQSEAEELQKAGFGKGANTTNTLVIGPAGVIDNTLRFDDEFARHKIMDLVGDLTLLGADLHAHVIAQKTGHASNVELVTQLRARMEELESQGVIQRDTGLDVREIMKIIPHRYPFLFIDRVISVEGFQRAVAIKNVTVNEPHFQGHWPGQPIMPGVLQVEALAQLAGVLLMRRLENTGKVAVMLSIDKIKFRRPVVPGDQLRLECETLNIRSKSGKVVGRGTVNGELTVESILKFMLMDA